jgi:hypothetical protein
MDRPGLYGHVLSRADLQGGLVDRTYLRRRLMDRTCKLKGIGSYVGKDERLFVLAPQKEASAHTLD